MHQGTLQQIGSFSYFFTILEKTQLNSEHPDFHPLLAIFTQILEGLILNAWRLQCGSSLNNFAESSPTAESIFENACKILETYATPEPIYVPVTGNIKAPFKDLNLNTHLGYHDSDSETDDLPEPVVSNTTTNRPEIDIIHNNVTLMTCN